MKIIIILIITFLFLPACGGGSGSENSANQGFLALEFKERNEFNPDAEPGIIDNFKITVTGSSLDAPIVKYYSADTDTVQFDGFPDGATVEVKVEAINQNGFVVRRGYSDPVTITVNQTSQAQVEIFNVPIFTNVKPGGYVNVNRFVPKIFAPGEINFQLSDTIGEITTSLSDTLTGDVTLSVSESQYNESTRPVFISSLSVGEHVLSVADPDTKEATDITVTGYQSPTNKVLTTTAGSHFGVMGRAGSNGSNMETYLQQLVE
jgi:hypothetical protein